MDKYLEIDNETDEIACQYRGSCCKYWKFLKKSDYCAKKRNFEIDIIGLQNRRKKYSVFNN